jgi:pilus assembly protein Flp/PilA
MRNKILNCVAFVRSLAAGEQGQDLVEYALTVALIAFGATVAMQSLGTGLNSTFTAISSTLSSSLT